MSVGSRGLQLEQELRRGLSPRSQSTVIRGRAGSEPVILPCLPHPNFGINEGVIFYTLPRSNLFFPNTTRPPASTSLPPTPLPTHTHTVKTFPERSGLKKPLYHQRLPPPAMPGRVQPPSVPDSPLTLLGQPVLAV